MCRPSIVGIARFPVSAQHPSPLTVYMSSDKSGPVLIFNSLSSMSKFHSHVHTVNFVESGGIRR